MVGNDHEVQDGTDITLTMLLSTTEPFFPSASGTSLINAAKSTKTTIKEDELHPADLRKFLSEDHVKKSVTSTKSLNTMKFKANNVTHYTILSYSASIDKRGALIDRGSNVHDWQ